MGIQKNHPGFFLKKKPKKTLNPRVLRVFTDWVGLGWAFKKTWVFPHPVTVIYTYYIYVVLYLSPLRRYSYNIFELEKLHFYSTRSEKCDNIKIGGKYL